MITRLCGLQVLQQPGSLLVLCTNADHLHRQRPGRNDTNASSGMLHTAGPDACTHRLLLNLHQDKAEARLSLHLPAGCWG